MLLHLLTCRSQTSGGSGSSVSYFSVLFRSVPVTADWGSIALAPTLTANPAHRLASLRAVGLIAAFFVVAGFFVWRGWRQWKLTKQAEEQVGVGVA